MAPQYAFVLQFDRLAPNRALLLARWNESFPREVVVACAQEK